MTNTPSPDEDLVTILSSVCGAHFDEACKSCQSAKESNDRRLESLLSDRAKLEEALGAAFDFLGGVDGAADIRDQLLAALSQSHRPYAIGRS